MKILGSCIIGVLTAMFGINVWNFDKGIIDIKNTIILFTFVSLWLIIYSLLEKNK